MTTKYAVRPDRLAQLDQLNLSYGSHETFEDGHCAMEVVAWLAGQGHTDAPACTSPVIARFTTRLNDGWDLERRQALKPYLPRMVGTSGDGLDEARAYLALDWLVRTYTPEWLDLAGLTSEARGLRELSQIVDKATAEAAVSAARRARDKANAARDAAWAAAGAAAVNAAEGAVRNAFGAAAGSASRDTAAWAAAGDAAWDAAWAAARATACVAAWHAAWATACVAAGAAAGNALHLTVETLQASALDLFDAMIDPRPNQEKP